MANLTELPGRQQMSEVVYLLFCFVFLPLLALFLFCNALLFLFSVCCCWLLCSAMTRTVRIWWIVFDVLVWFTAKRQLNGTLDKSFKAKQEQQQQQQPKKIKLNELISTNKKVICNRSDLICWQSELAQYRWTCLFFVEKSKKSYIGERVKQLKKLHTKQLQKGIRMCIELIQEYWLGKSFALLVCLLTRKQSG